VLIGCFACASEAISAVTLSFSALTESVKVAGPLGPCNTSVQSPRNGAASAAVTWFVPCAGGTAPLAPAAPDSARTNTPAATTGRNVSII
jgi:hypothetical protein